MRGALLIAAAVLIGVLLLNATDSGDGDPAASGGDPTDQVTTTTAPEAPPAAQARPAGEVKVLVANGAGVKGAAKGFSDFLGGLGYNVLAATNTTESAAAAAVLYAPGFELEAAAVAAQLGLGEGAAQPMPAPPPVDDLRTADVLIVLDRVLAEAGPPAQTADPAPSG